MLSAMIERALLPVQRNKTLNSRSLIVSSLRFAARRRAARPGLPGCGFARLLGAYERTHELAIDRGRNGVHVHALAGQEFARIVDLVDSGWLDADRLEPGDGELQPIVILIERSGDAADPGQHVATNHFGNRPAGDDVGDGEAAARLQHAERLTQHAILVG